MESINIFEEIKHYKKDFVFEAYARIIKNYKDYDNITKVKMMESVCRFYKSPENIIDICTCRELKYLKLVLDYSNKKDKELLKEIYKDKYEWERDNLHKKLLLFDNFKYKFIPNEIIDSVSLALKKVNYSKKKKIDEISEIAVSYCKIHGSGYLSSLRSLLINVLSLEEDVVDEYLINNKLFNYYVYTDLKNVEYFEEAIPCFLYQDYFDYEDDIAEERKKYHISGQICTDIKYYKILFYNDFDINNPKIVKFLDELKKLPFFWFSVINDIKIFALLDMDRKLLKDAFINVPALKNIDLTEFFKVMDAAMDEMPSGALNGLTPNEAKVKMKEKENLIREKERKYIKQKGACLSRKDADLFYKIYFSVLEYTNRKYNINKKVNISKCKRINPYDISDVVTKFWDNKDSIIKEFILNNPYRFNKEELDIVDKFKFGKRSLYIMVKYELEYTAFMCEDRVYMVKGLNDNIDNVISYKDLPCSVITTIIPFKNYLVYDGMLNEYGISIGTNLEKQIEKDYINSIKYYHM